MWHATRQTHNRTDYYEYTDHNRSGNYHATHKHHDEKADDLRFVCMLWWKSYLCKRCLQILRQGRAHYDSFHNDTHDQHFDYYYKADNSFYARIILGHSIH